MTKANFLDFYIEEKIREYKEPSRKGTPKGDIIGFSFVKYKACLYIALKNMKDKEVANLLGISYGLVRKWKTEKEFKKEMDELRMDYSLLFWDKFIGKLYSKYTLETFFKIEEDLNKIQKEIAEYNPNLLVKISSRTAFYVMQDIIGSSDEYSSALNRLISTSISLTLQGGEFSSKYNMPEIKGDQSNVHLTIKKSDLLISDRIIEDVIGYLNSLNSISAVKRIDGLRWISNLLLIERIFGMKQ